MISAFLKIISKLVGYGNKLTPVDLNGEEEGRYISGLIVSDKPCKISRFGYKELCALQTYLVQKEEHHLKQVLLSKKRNTSIEMWNGSKGEARLEDFLVNGG